MKSTHGCIANLGVLFILEGHEGWFVFVSTVNPFNALNTRSVDLVYDEIYETFYRIQEW